MKISGKFTYVLLSAALVVCVGGMGFLGYSIFVKDNTIKMQNFEDASKIDVLKWVTTNKLEDKIKYEYEYSETIEEGNVISQSIKENEKISEPFTITISKGSIIKLDVNDYKTKAEFEAFIAKYPKVKVTYENGSSENKNSELLKFSKDNIDIKSDQLIVFLSKESNSKDTNKDNKDDNKDNKVTIPNNLLGIEESKFIKTLNDLGFKNLKKNETKYYSFTSKKDTIYSYDDGKFETSKTINYAISLGDYPTSFNAKEYDGHTLDEANKVVKKYNDLNAHITLTTTNLETNDSKLVGKLVNTKCKKDGTKSIITANVYVAQSQTISVGSYAGQAESVMLEALKKQGITKFNKQSSKYSSYAYNTIAYNDSGNKTKNDTINYYLSLGKYEYSSGDFVNQSLDNLNSKVNYYNSLNANINFVPSEQEIYDNPANHNIITTCTPAYYNDNRVTLTCTVLKFTQTYSLMKADFYIQTKSGNSYEETVSNMKNVLSDFTNVTYNPVSSEEKGPGQILDITVDGQVIDVNAKYKPNVHIVVTIVQTQTN